jgi:hypothetical protein
MPGFTRAAEAAEAPSRVQLAIREWQRQLIAMAEAARSGSEAHTAAAGADHRG